MLFLLPFAAMVAIGFGGIKGFYGGEPGMVDTPLDAVMVVLFFVCALLTVVALFAS